MKWALRAVLVIGFVGVAAGVALVWWARGVLEEPVSPPPETVVDIQQGSSAASILRTLESAGVVSNATLARFYLVGLLDDASLKAGEYRFSEPATTSEVLERLIAGDVMTHRVTLIEGWDLDETAAHLAAEGFGERDLFLAEMRSPERISDLDSKAITLEGYLFPDTYAFPGGTAEAEIVDALVQAFRRQLEALEPRLDGQNPLELRALVTLASIVEKEAALDSERATIAGVYTNRLDRGIALYADPTVIFALKLLGRWDGNIRKKDLDVESPYNTYRNPGLPPGPICSPGFASLQAARRPADVPYIYFVSRNDGSHVFATTLAEHNRNVDEWQRRYWRERSAQESKP